MNKLLISVLCGVALTLTACDKKPASQTDQTAAVQQSTNNTADIKADLIALNTLSNSNTAELDQLQSKIMQAVQKQDKAAMQEGIKEVSKSTSAFNEELDKLSLKSTEINMFREKLKATNQVTLDMLKEASSEKPDQAKILKLQNESMKMQQELATANRELQTKVSKS